MIALTGTIGKGAALNYQAGNRRLYLYHSKTNNLRAFNEKSTKMDRGKYGASVLRQVGIGLGIAKRTRLKAGVSQA